MTGHLPAAATCVVISCLLFTEPAHPFPNEPDGFRGLAWGQDVSGAPGMVYLDWKCVSEESIRYFRDKLDYKIYERKEDDLRLGSAFLTAIKYYTWQDRLRSVILTAPEKEREIVLRILEARFGKGKPVKSPEGKSRDIATWTGAKTVITLVQTNKSVEVHLESAGLAKEERRYRRELSVKRLRDKEDLDRRAIEEGHGF